MATRVSSAMTRDSVLLEFWFALRNAAPDTAAPMMLTQPITEQIFAAVERTVSAKMTRTQALMNTSMPRRPWIAMAAGPLAIALPKEAIRPLPWSAAGTDTYR